MLFQYMPDDFVQRMVKLTLIPGMRSRGGDAFRGIPALHNRNLCFLLDYLLFYISTVFLDHPTLVYTSIEDLNEPDGLLLALR